MIRIAFMSVTMRFANQPHAVLMQQTGADKGNRREECEEEDIKNG